MADTVTFNRKNSPCGGTWGSLSASAGNFLKSGNRSAVVAARAAGLIVSFINYVASSTNRFAWSIKYNGKERRR